MEHNEYSLYKVKVKGTRRIINHVNHADTEVVGLSLFEEVVNVVAPTDKLLAIPLIDYSLRSMSWDIDKFETEIVSVEALKAIIRFENSYRGRM